MYGAINELFFGMLHNQSISILFPLQIFVMLHVIDSSVHDMASLPKTVKTSSSYVYGAAVCLQKFYCDVMYRELLCY